MREIITQLIMKTIRLILLSALGLGFVAIISTRTIDVADFVVAWFLGGMIVWTIAQYVRVPRRASVAPPIMFPAQAIGLKRSPIVESDRRLAA